MSYTPTTDFVDLLRQTSSGVQDARVPGLDFVVAALARAGLLRLSVGQTAPIVNQPTTAWFKPALPSWTAEGVLFLWNATTAQYETATPALWNALAIASAPPDATANYSFQVAASAAVVINPGVSLLAVRRTAPLVTALVLPNITAQWLTGRKLQIVDFSIGVVNHTVTISTADGSSIMQQATLQLLSTSVQLSGVMLQPSPDLNAWVIAP